MSRDDCQSSLITDFSETERKSERTTIDKAPIPAATADPVSSPNHPIEAGSVCENSDVVSGDDADSYDTDLEFDDNGNRSRRRYPDKHDILDPQVFGIVNLCLPIYRLSPVRDQRESIESCKHLKIKELPFVYTILTWVNSLLNLCTI